MREKLCNARKSLGKTQREIALMLEISEVYYRKIEAGTREGKARLWDKLQELFGLDQRELRKNTNN